MHLQCSQVIMVFSLPRLLLGADPTIDCVYMYMYWLCDQLVSMLSIFINTRQPILTTIAIMNVISILCCVL